VLGSSQGERGNSRTDLLISKKPTRLMSFESSFQSLERKRMMRGDRAVPLKTASML
jgi:hypothetical protein